MKLLNDRLGLGSYFISDGNNTGNCFLSPHQDYGFTIISKFFNLGNGINILTQFMKQTLVAHVAGFIPNFCCCTVTGEGAEISSN